MCIRDRKKTAEKTGKTWCKDKIILERTGLLRKIQNRAKKFYRTFHSLSNSSKNRSIKSVSYTHLDVYKRQIYFSATIAAFLATIAEKCTATIANCPKKSSDCKNWNYPRIGKFSNYTNQIKSKRNRFRSARKSWKLSLIHI